VIAVAVIGAAWTSETAARVDKRFLLKAQGSKAVCIQNELGPALAPEKPKGDSSASSFDNSLRQLPMHYFLFSKTDWAIFGALAAPFSPEYKYASALSICATIRLKIRRGAEAAC
jgi:hypothetical protein